MTRKLLLVIPGVTCHRALGFSFLFLYLIQDLFKKCEVQSSPACTPPPPPQ